MSTYCCLFKMFHESLLSHLCCFAHCRWLGRGLYLQQGHRCLGSTLPEGAPLRELDQFNILKSQSQQRAKVQQSTGWNHLRVCATHVESLCVHCNTSGEENATSYYYSKWVTKNKLYSGSSCVSLTKAEVASLTFSAEVVHQDELLEQMWGGAAEHAVHRAQQCGPHLIHEAHDDGGGRQVVVNLLLQAPAWRAAMGLSLPKVIHHVLRVGAPFLCSLYRTYIHKHTHFIYMHAY